MRECVLLLGKDLIGVQNLLKKHQALQAEIAGHEPRIKAVTQKGNAMVEEGEWVYSVPGPGPSQQGQGWVPFSFCYVSFAVMSGVLLTIIPPGHFAAEDVKAKLSELNQKWEALKAKASQRRQDLEDSLQAQQYFADANEAESWMREKEPIVGSTDYGKDEDSAEVAQTWPSHVMWWARLRVESKIAEKGKYPTASFLGV